jgi:hypothetical protein
MDAAHGRHQSGDVQLASDLDHDGELKLVAEQLQDGASYGLPFSTAANLFIRSMEVRYKPGNRDDRADRQENSRSADGLFTPFKGDIAGLQH